MGFIASSVTCCCVTKCHPVNKLCHSFSRCLWGRSSDSLSRDSLSLHPKVMGGLDHLRCLPYSHRWHLTGLAPMTGVSWAGPDAWGLG